ncbi:response regulator transcription factor [Domibacillus enclensis]|uniref:DNA-binding response regulator n=1 Tax=Domibacillus enclensis TaxID=1017273 RepID=A0A1N6V649_9BACI|nr:response regulator [Domibacillus enclensis]OXS78708.1 DNA-binding response regulator [Domibacillus enclensis]SIQ73341.1 two-component system, response regulator YesN [Domibacillus enclensis]
MINVIIADDEPLILKNLQLIIPWNDLGCDVRGTAKNGQEAYELCRQMDADLLLTDISMPEVTGLELLKKLHQLPNKPLSIIISGYDEFEYAREGLKYNAMDYILKPIDYAELQQCIQKAVRHIKERSTQQYELEKQRLYEAVTTGVFEKDARRFRKPLIPLLFQHPPQAFPSVPSIEGQKMYSISLSSVQHVVLLEVELEDRQTLLGRLTYQEADTKILIGLPLEGEEEVKPAVQKLMKWMDVHHVFEESALLIEEAEQKYQSKKSATDAIGHARSFIEAHFYEDISAEQAADYAGISISYFSLLFKQVTGSTFLDYVTTFRIEKACRMLVQTQLKTYEIAEKVGYTDQRYFSQVFKKRVGVTPSEYRKQYAK